MKRVTTEHRTQREQRKKELERKLSEARTRLAGKEYFTELEAAAYLGFTPRFMQQRRVTGDSPPFSRVSGRALRYSKRALDIWMAERQRSSTSDAGQAA